MGRQKQTTGKLRLLNRNGMGAGLVFDTFLIGHFFNLFIICGQDVIANGRIFRRWRPNIEFCHIFFAGVAASVHKRVKQGTTAQQPC